MTEDLKKTIITPIFRTSFPWVITPRANENEDGTKGEPKYGVTAVFDVNKFTPADKKRWLELRALGDAVSLTAFKKKIDALPANFKKGIRDCEEKEGLAGFEIVGGKFINFTTKRKPGIVDKDKVTRIVDDPDAFYAGCFARAKVNCYSYNNKGKGVAFGLMSLMKVGDGPRIDGGSDAEKDFADHDLTAADEAWLAANGGTDGNDDDAGF
jgi:hypothetical protein